MIVRILFMLLSVWSVLTFAKPVKDFLPQEQNYLTTIPTPEQVLGFDIGQRHPRYDQYLEYYKTLAESSNRLKISEIGSTYEHRKQIILTISAADNLAKLDEHLNARKTNSANQQTPLVIWLGYSIHGDEASGANAAMVVAYHLAASQNPEVEQLLANSIIVIEPVSNPDGLDRFSQWVGTYRGASVNSNPDHMEHHQGWISGRGNHFWFDLNRDWLVASQQETKNRLAVYQQYQPNVLADFHEMAPNQSYFFQPGVATRIHPLTPKTNIELTKTLAQYHAKALDQQQRLYFTEEAFDDFYYGKGSTYPDINGGIGLLFEQASSRGYQLSTSNGVLTFEYSIENHVFTSLSTLAGAWQNRDKLKAYRKDFYQQAKEAADDEEFDGYFIYEEHDLFRLNSFLSLLQQHQINAYSLTSDFELAEQKYRQPYGYYIPLAQPQYRMIKAIFSQQKEFVDNSFYDISGWTLPLAMDIDFYPVEKTRNLKIAEQPWQKKAVQAQTINPSYAYAFQWHHFLAPKLLNQLLAENIQVQVASKEFSALVNQQNKVFAKGTMIIAAGQQKHKNFLATLTRLANANEIEIFPLNSALTITGADLGSESMVNISPVNTLLIGGDNVSALEVGEMLFYLDQQLNIPVTLVEENRLKNINFNRYSHIIMVDGNYNNLSEDTVLAITNFVKAGGIIYAQKRAAKWLSDKDILKVHFIPRSTIHQMFNSDYLAYDEFEQFNARKQITGAIFASKLDLSHPLAFGFTDENLPLLKNSVLIMDNPRSPFVNIANFTKKPLLSGYTDQLVVNQIASNSAVIARSVGAGKIIASSENLAFRGHWYGSAKLISNTLFLAKLIDARAR